MDIQRMARNGARSLDIMFREKRVLGQILQVQRGPRYLSYHVGLKNPADLKNALSISDEIAMGANVESVIVRRDRGRLYYDFNLPDEGDLWMNLALADTSGEVVGIGAGAQTVSFVFDDNTPNWLVAGEMGSGKSAAIATAVLSLCRRMDPNRLGIGIVDVHQDIHYEGFYNATHLVSKPAVTVEEVDTLLKWFHSQLLFRRGLGQSKFERQYRKGEHKMLVLVIDEASRNEVLGTYKSIHREHQELVRDLVQEGRKFRIHTILGTQKPMENDLPGIFSMLGSRMVGYTQAGYVTGRAEAAAHLLTKKGDFFRVHGQHVDRFLWAYPQAADYERILSRTGEIPTLTVPEATGTIDLSNSVVGRPVTKMDPAILAVYMTQNVSVRNAKSELDLGYNLHSRYRKFAEKLNGELERLKGGENEG